MNDWIRVEEKLPEEGFLVLAFGFIKTPFGKTYAICLDRLVNGDRSPTWEGSVDEWGNDFVVTHWTPLPAPPEEEHP